MYDKRFLIKSLEKQLSKCQAAARRFNNIITEAGVTQMIAKGITIDETNVSDLKPEDIARAAMKYLGISCEDTIEEYIQAYIDLMVLNDKLRIDG